MKHRTIPVFIPEMACPFRCIYCNQHVISGQQKMPTDDEIIKTIDTYLATMPEDAKIELGFFGGTFTGIPIEQQQRLLHLVSPYLLNGFISSIRLSTRPDYIDERIVEMLAEGGVGTVELGVQSMNEEVLKKVHRGYDPRVVERAAAMIRHAGMEVGMQMMIGLPGDTPEKSVHTARRIIDLGATNTRIYPTLVVKQTALASLFDQGKYHALTLDEAVVWTAPVLKLFEENDVTVLRVGLHPTEGFINHTDYLAGPFHVSFKELVMTEIFRQQFDTYFRQHPLPSDSHVVIRVNPQKLNAAIGYNTRNSSYLRKLFKQVKFVVDASLKGYEFTVVTQ